MAGDACVEQPPQPVATLDEDAETGVWQAIQAKLAAKDGRRALFLDLFVERCEVTTMVDALVKAPEFVEEFLVDGLDYRAFIESAGLSDALTDEEFKLYREHSMREDIAEGVQMIQEMCMLIGKKVGLSAEDLATTAPPGHAIRVIPKCAYVNTLLPGALNTARALKNQLPSQAQGDEFNPFVSDEAAATFVAEHGAELWDDVQLAVHSDGPIVSSCSGCMRVDFVSKADVVAILSLRPVDLQEQAPHPEVCKKVTEFTNEGPDVLLEVEVGIADLFEEGMLIDGDWFELENGVWLLGSFLQIRPGLRAPAPDKDEDEEKAPAPEAPSDAFEPPARPATDAACADAGGELGDPEL